ncbi:MAG: hypothetical protein PVI01_00150 [Gemmatimonadales bacterium]|jgi:hypothetical protein
MTGPRQSQQGKTRRSGHEQAQEPRRRATGSTDTQVVDEYGLAIGRPGEWLPNFDDAFDLDFPE